MYRHIRHTIGVLGLSLGLALAYCSPAGASTGPDRSISITRIGAAHFTDTLTSAARSLDASGEIGRRAFGQSLCSLTYPKHGLRIWFEGYRAGTAGHPPDCQQVVEVLATGAGWHTAGGLYIGDSTARIRQLYPKAYNTRHSGPLWVSQDSIQWDITITCCGGGLRPAMSVAVRSGRVVGIFVMMVGHP